MAKRQIAAALTALLAAGLLYAATLRAPEAKSVAAERITQTVTLQAISGWSLQMDACETPLMARISAARMTQRGSAGYVLCGDRSRVLGIMLDSADEAQQMQQRLQQNGVQAEVYACAGQSLTLRVTADAGQIQALTQAVHAIDMAAMQPGRIAMQLDAGEIDAEYARGMIAMLVSDLECAQADFSAADARGALSDSLDALLRAAIDALAPLTDPYAGTDLMLAGSMRCAGMHVWFARENMIAQMNSA